MAKFPPSILFCGKHRVNFAMFHSVYERLRHDPSVRLLVSSGRYRWRPIVGWIRPEDPSLLNEAIFPEFNLDPKHLHKTSNRDKYPYEVYVTSNLDRKMLPPNSHITVQIFHGVSFRNFAVNEKYLRFDKLFFPGKYHLEKYIERGILKPDDSRIELMGLPKLDCLVDNSIRREDVLKRLGLDPALPTVLWCPTGAENNSLDRLGPAGLKAAQNGEWNFIMKLHDHPHLRPGVKPQDIEKMVRDALGPRGRIAPESNVAPLLVAADLLISDASSVANEFCLRDRPIVFVDVPDLLQARAAMPGCAMDLDTHGRNMGQVVNSAEELTEAIKAGLANPTERSAARRAVATHLFHEPGTAGARMAAKLVDMAKNSLPRKGEAGRL